MINIKNNLLKIFIDGQLFSGSGRWFSKVSDRTRIYFNNSPGSKYLYARGIC